MVYLVVMIIFVWYCNFEVDLVNLIIILMVEIGRFFEVGYGIFLLNFDSFVKDWNYDCKIKKIEDILIWFWIVSCVLINYKIV